MAVVELQGETFGSRIRRLRRERGLTQRQCADQLGIDFTYLSKLENDQIGQSPGDALVRKLAELLEDNPERLLVLAGKVPVEALRTRARGDADFAWLLQRLPGLPSGIGHLIVPTSTLGHIEAIKIADRLAKVASADEASSAGRLYWYHTGTFRSQQDEYLIGVVSDRAHRDRLREAHAPIHEILTLRPGAETIEDLSVAEIRRECQLSLRCRLSEDDPYEEVDLRRLGNLSRVWSPSRLEDDFPLVILRAQLPTSSDGREKTLELRYGIPMEEPHGYLGWSASRPMYVSTIAVDAQELVGDHELTFQTFLPSPTLSSRTAEGFYEVGVDDWIGEGHGFTLIWWPKSRASGAHRSPGRQST